MSFDILMRQCADHEDGRQQYAAALERAEAALAKIAIFETRMGKVEKLWSATDYDDHSAAVISTQLECAQAGHESAKAIIKELANTTRRRHERNQTHSKRGHRHPCLQTADHKAVFLCHRSIRMDGNSSRSGCAGAHRMRC